MRKITVGLFMSLDGVVEAPEKWTFQYFNPEIGAHIGARIMASDTLLLGRVTYQSFEATFSKQKGQPADGLNSIRKYVVSTTLKTADWNNSTVINGNVVEEITKLKQQPGKDIAISGSVGLVKLLMQHDLIDEYSLMVYPIVLGTGIRLFADGMAQLPLKLIQTKPLGDAVVALRYQPDRK